MGAAAGSGAGIGADEGAGEGVDAPGAKAANDGGAGGYKARPGGPSAEHTQHADQLPQPRASRFHDHIR